MSERLLLKYDPSRWTEEIRNYTRTFLLFVTDRCPQRCRSCFNCGNLGKAGDMRVDYVQQIVLANPQIAKYDIMGGEPLLHPNIDGILSMLLTHHKHVTVYTNADLVGRLDPYPQNVRICVSFDGLDRSSQCFKPLRAGLGYLQAVPRSRRLKLVYLLSKHNANTLPEAAGLVEDHLPGISTLTIGAIRNEADYWRDDPDYTLPLQDYARTVEGFLNNYSGRLNAHVFTKGILYTPSLPAGASAQVNRFKCIFPHNMYAPCLYAVGTGGLLPFDPAHVIPFADTGVCSKTGSTHCLADKIYLRRLPAT